MITRGETLKLIKGKVDGHANGKIKLKKNFLCEFKEGVILITKSRRIISLLKDGNSVMWMDDCYCMHNITVLSTNDLHKIMWQLISEKEKKDIALKHLLETKTYLAE